MHIFDVDVVLFSFAIQIVAKARRQRRQQQFTAINAGASTRSFGRNLHFLATAIRFHFDAML